MSAKRSPKKAPGAKATKAAPRKPASASSKRIGAKKKGKADAPKKVMAVKKDTAAAKAKPPARKKASPARPKTSLNLPKFRRQLRERHAELLESYRAARGDSRSRESDGTEDYIDYAVSSYDRDFLLSLSELERTELKLVEEALERIEQGGFGLCSHCERPIPAKRLEVQPWARHCLRCQELAEMGHAEGASELPSDEEEFGEGEEPSADEGVDLDFEDEDQEDALDEDRLIGG